MRSKWLNWQPGSEIIEQAPDAQPTKPSKPGSVGFEGTAQRVFPITGARREQVLAKISRLIEPAGLAEWPWRERPERIFEGRERFAAVDQALSHADGKRLERALADLASHHADCCRNNRLHLQNAEQGFLEGRRHASGQPLRESSDPATLSRRKTSCRSGTRPKGAAAPISARRVTNHLAQYPCGRRDSVRRTPHEP